MSQYRIVCTRKELAYEPITHSHIVGLGTGDASCSRPWTTGEIYVALDNGDKFYSACPSTLEIATVRKHICPTCKCFHTVRISDEAASDNSLDRMPRCE